MAKPKPFSKKVSEELKSYVYLYIDPRGERVFYVGKGKGSRCFAHLGASGSGHKASVLRELRANGVEPQIEILRYGLSDEEATLVESCVIDLFDLSELTNAVRGYHWSRGPRGTVEELRVTLEALPVEIRGEDAVVLINLARLYRPGMTVNEIYDAARHAWKLNPERHHPRYAFALHAGIVREVFEIARWLPAGSTLRTHDQHGENHHDQEPGRWEFVGRPAPAKVRDRYLHRSVGELLPPGMANPVKYVNC